MTNVVIILISGLMLLLAILSYIQSGGILTITFLVMFYILFLFLGSLQFYFSEGHLTFLLIFIAALFYFIGIIAINGKLKFNFRKYVGRQIKVHTKLNASILKLALILSTVILIYVQLLAIPERLSTIFAGEFYHPTALPAAETLKGEFLNVSGLQGLFVIFLIAYLVYIYKKQPIFKRIAFLSLLFYFVFSLSTGAKKDAIFPFLYWLVSDFYINKKVDRRKVAVSIALVSVSILFVGYFWVKKEVNGLTFSAIKLYYSRMTYWSVNTFDYMLYNYFPYYPYQYGNTLLLEIRRIFSQITLAPKMALFNEIIGNMMAGVTYSHANELIFQASPELTIFGMFYANFGILGTIFGSLFLGIFTQWLNIFLLSRKSSSVFCETFLIMLMLNVIGYCRSGNLLMVIESYLIQVLPVTILLTLIYLILYLPMANKISKHIKNISLGVMNYER